jgi:prepilin-type N-terminal cleavage/methylation domain-containing protein
MSGKEPSPAPVRFRSGKPCRKSGFTLIELLVVIAIIAALSSVAIYATLGTRKRAMQVNAMSSLRQVAAFSTAYSTENNGDINTIRLEGDPREGGDNAEVSNTFWGRLQPFLFPEADNSNQEKLRVELAQRLDQLFNSTDADTMAGTYLKGAKIYHDSSGLPVPIGFNANLYQSGKTLKIGNFSDSSQIIYATYGYEFFSEKDGKSYAPVPTNNTDPANKIYYFDNKTAATSFLDGHMEILNTPIPDRRFK